MMTRLTYFYAAVVIAALATIPTAPAGEESISNLTRTAVTPARIQALPIIGKAHANKLPTHKQRSIF